jgi:hypothetical protein
MPGTNWRRIALGLLMVVTTWFGVGCGESSPPPAPIPVVMGTNGPPSAAAADVKNPTTPPAIEPTYSRPTVIDYGPPSAASADAARFKGR